MKRAAMARAAGRWLIATSHHDDRPDDVPQLAPDVVSASYACRLQLHNECSGRNDLCLCSCHDNPFDGGGTGTIDNAAGEPVCGVDCCQPAFGHDEGCGLNEHGVCTCDGYCPGCGSYGECQCDAESDGAS